VRLTLVISSLASGGAERVLATLANCWVTDGHHVTVLTFAPVAHDRQCLDRAITRVALDVMSRSTTPVQAVRNNWRRLTRLRDQIQRSRPDAVISFLSTTNVLTLAATRNLRIPIVVAERIDPREEPIGAVWAGMRRLLYPTADALVVQTSDVAGWAVRLVATPKVYVIPNPVIPNEWSPETDGAGTPEWLARPGYKVLAMGRLTRQKGFDLLLRAFAKCRLRHPAWSLVILGEGEERHRLEVLAADLGIDADVVLPGHVTEPARILRRADLFVLASRYEGFPNALLEAMACGLPVIATDCPSGPRQIVRDGVDGLLVQRESVEALAAAMQHLMSAPETRQQLSARAIDVAERFSVRNVMHQWGDLLARCTHPA
jgi:GalNAc-alpha-(1->4)-GalNAc-alpha-(1->3)-diNAcBac-PP-undecaprenol alpha-1,4-N-acetyl-D-galactosaminyltransferase